MIVQTSFVPSVLFGHIYNITISNVRLSVSSTKTV